MVGGIRLGSIGFKSAVHAPSASGGRNGLLGPNVNLVGGKSFTAKALSDLLKKNGNTTVTLAPGQSFTIKNPNPALTNRVTDVNANSPITAASSRDINASSYKISVKPGVKSGKDAIKLKTYELTDGSKPAKLKGTVSFTVAVVDLRRA